MSRIKLKLKNLVNIYNGSTPSTSISDNFDGSIVWITPKDISDQKTKYIYRGERHITEKGLREIGNKLLPNGTILFSSRAPIGLMSISKHQVSTNQGFKNLICKEAKISNEYLYYLLKTQISKIQELGSGTTFKEVSKTTLENFELFIENDLSIQKKIASVLSAFDDKIELNNRINTELEQMAKTLYDYWFVQFDFPNEDGKPYKSSGGKMVYNEVLKREVPEGWEVTVFNDWVQNTKTGDWGKEKVEGNYTERVYCVRGADINGLNGKGDVKAPERFILKNNLSKQLEPNDFIIEISGGSPTQSTARIALLTIESFERFDTNIVCSNFCKAVTLKDEKYVYNFLKEWQRLYDAGVFFGFEGKTSGIKNFLFESFMDSYQIVKPEKELVKEFNSFSKIIEKKRQSNLKQNQELTQLRDWLLPMLMNGQVKVNNEYVPNDENLSMAAEPIVAYVNDADLNIPANKRGFAKQVLAGKIVSEFKDDPNFTDIKFQKIQFLAEHTIEADLNLNYYYQAAGPYDNKFMHTIYTNFSNQQWFDYQDKKFIPLEKQEKIEGYYQGYFAPVQERLNKLFELLYQTSEAEAEIIATLYAVWNNRIIEGRPVTDHELKEDFYKWSDRKLQYKEEQLFASLQWLKENQMEPKGFGRLIKKAKRKIDSYDIARSQFI